MEGERVIGALRRGSFKFFAFPNVNNRDREDRCCT